MNKEQQIEEMQKKMQKCYEKYGSLNFKWFAEALYNAGYRKVPKRLAELENKIEDGLLIELPCKIGDTIYVVPSEVNFRLNKLFHGGELNYAYEQPVSSISVYPDDIVIHTCDDVEMVSMKMYGERWFLTEEEAKKRLEELENANM